MQYQKKKKKNKAGQVKKQSQELTGGSGEEVMESGDQQS